MGIPAALQDFLDFALNGDLRSGEVILLGPCHSTDPLSLMYLIGIEPYVGCTM
ncbi:hypothetical protein HDU77_000389, partial [Chytriomyces hyalinus]